MRRNNIIALLLLAAALTIFALILGGYGRQGPASIEQNDHGASISLQVDDNVALLPSECSAIRWKAEPVQAVEINGKGLPGEGSKQVCTDATTLSVKFQDGTTQDYTIVKQTPVDNRASRIALVGAVFLLLAALTVSSLPDLLARQWNRLPLARVIERLPRPDYADQQTSPPSVFFAAVVVIVLIVAAVRAHELDGPIRYDESWTYVDFASKPLWVGLTSYWSTNNHLFHTLLAHLSTSVWGVQPWTLRLPVFFAGVLVVAATYAVGRRLYSAASGLMASALAAGASWLIGYSANARGYMLVTLFFLLLLLLASSLRRKRSPRRWAQFAVCGALGLYSVPSMVYPLGIVVVWLGLSILLNQRIKGRSLLLRDFLVTLAAMALLTGLLYAAPLLTQRTYVPRELDLGSFNEQRFASALSTYQSVAEDVWTSLNLPWNSLAALLGVGWLVAILVRPKPRAEVSLPLAAALWLITVLFIATTNTYQRIWSFIQPLYLIVGSAGLVYAGQAIVGRRNRARPFLLASATPLLAAVIGASALAGNSVDRTMVPNTAVGTEQAVMMMRNDMHPGDRAFCYFTCTPFGFYGAIYHVEFTPLTSHNRWPTNNARQFSVQSGDRVYFVVGQPPREGSLRLESITALLGIPATAYAAPTRLVDRSQFIVYRVDFVQAVRATITEPSR